MEAAEKTLTYRDDTGLHRKLLTDEKERKKDHDLLHLLQHRAAGTHSDESNYVDLDMKTVKVSFTGEGNQLSVIKCAEREEREEQEEQEEQEGESRILPEGEDEEERGTVPGPVPDDPPLETKLAELGPSDCSEHAGTGSGDELRYTDMYLNSRTESDDGASAVLSDQCGSDTVEDESHYITTHEIQLTELDHDVDYDLGRGTCWEFEDDNLVYSFVDYASFESDETQEGTLILEGRSLQAGAQSNLGGAAVSTEQEESDLCDSDKCASSDESLGKNQCEDPNPGKIHLSIKTSSRAVNEPLGVFDSATCEYSKHSADSSRYSFVRSGARAGPLCDRAQYFIPAPGRQHLATKLRRKDINEYSSGASSSISELDDADKEVRNLTAKSFRSLACPYFDAINLSTSSESSVSEYGLNKWSAYVDWNYGNISRGGERSVIAHKTSSATLEMNRTVDSKAHDQSMSGMKASQTQMFASNNRTASQQATSSSKNIQLGDPVPPAQRGVTLNFRCNVEDGSRGPRGSRKARTGEVAGTFLARSGCEMQYHTDGMGDTHKRAIFASSLLKNVISKKMQFEQERKMERGEIRDTYPAVGQGRGLQRQISESGSGFTVNSADDQRLEGGRPPSSASAEEIKTSRAPEDSEQLAGEPQRALLIHSESSAFNALKEDGPESGRAAELRPGGDTRTVSEEGLDSSSMLTKLLFVPSCQLLPKDKDFTEALTGHVPLTVTAAGSQKSEKEFKSNISANRFVREEIEKGGKAPEIKICLRSVKENKGCTLNIASLLTPKISYNVNAFRTPDETRCHILSAAERVPNFTVRDIRENKCKFQTPIYHVRDVRKLVKSSYRFVSLDSSENKCSVADKLEEKAKMEPVKHLLPSPIVIKCNSVKTKNNSQKQAEADDPSETTQSEQAASQCPPSRVPAGAAKQGQAEPSEIQTNLESKLTKQRQEKFSGETADRRSDPALPKQDALEKLKAAVKTMEQLYVFDRNEWKRKTQAPRPITDSHVLSLIAREEQGAEETETANADRIPQPPTNATDAGRLQGEKRAMNIIHVPYDGNKAPVSVSSDTSIAHSSMQQQPPASRTPAVKIEPATRGPAEQGKVKASPSNPAVTAGCPDSENYLTIPGTRHSHEIKPSHRDGTSRVGEEKPADGKGAEQKNSPVSAERPATSVYHHLPHKQQRVFCFSPSVPPVSPTSCSGETLLQTQRKMLLDPTTGHYYLVDTPLQAATKRLFDPETGQYVDVPVSHSPVTPVTPVTSVTPVTPVPLSLSPLALNPGAYAPTYMIYPGFITSPPLAARPVLPSPCHSEEENAKFTKTPENSSAGAESAYYSATREAPPPGPPPPKLPVSLGHVTARGSHAASSDRKPVISITTQQGPRIIAPPSFDGTTMSFVVEHR